MKKKFLIIGLHLFFITLFSTVAMFSAHADSSEQKPVSLLQKLFDSYSESAKTDNTLRHLLDAKMYLISAEHDLLVSHDKEKARSDIESSIVYLVEAEKVATPKINKLIITLISNLKRLEQKTENTSESGIDNETDKLLLIANEKLLMAKEKASIHIKDNIDKIILSISTLRKQIEHTNLREDYESAMNLLSSIIKKL